jgi:ectoine hydroxylase
MTVTATRAADRYPTRVADRPTLLDRPDPTVWAPRDAAGPLPPDRLAAYDRDGFVGVEQLLTPDEAGTFAAELDRLATDPTLRADERTVVEKSSDEVRSVFEVHLLSDAIARLVADERLAGTARQILGSDVYVHQSRVNLKPGFGGGGFYWHSDFETWHAEDGMPAPRAVSCSIALTANHVHNGPLMIMPGAHRTFVACVGETPADHYKDSLREQEIGTPDPDSLTRLADRHGIAVMTGGPGSATFFDSNSMHGSGSNITPYPRSNIFVVFNSVENALVEPFAAPGRRPTHIASREIRIVRRNS